MDDGADRDSARRFVAGVAGRGGVDTEDVCAVEGRVAAKHDGDVEGRAGEDEERS